MAGLQRKSCIFFGLPRAVSKSWPQALLVPLTLILPAGGAMSHWGGKGR